MCFGQENMQLNEIITNLKKKIRENKASQIITLTFHTSNQIAVQEKRVKHIRKVRRLTIAQAPPLV